MKNFIKLILILLLHTFITQHIHAAQSAINLQHISNKSNVTADYHPLLNELKERGFIYKATDLEGLALALQNSIAPSGYIGFDCTATSLHAGSLMQIMLLRILQKHSIKTIIVLGGAASKIGDPSAGNTKREMMSDETIKKNMAGIKKSLAKFLTFGSGKNDTILLDDASWHDNLNHIEVIRNYPLFFSIHQKLSSKKTNSQPYQEQKFFSTHKKLNHKKIKSKSQQKQTLSFLEFHYPILQAYNFLYLAKNYNCILQLGGSDQWNNILFGIEFIKETTGKKVFGIVTPLLKTSYGIKMGKSQKDAILAQ